MTKTKLVLGIATATLTLAGAMVSPQAVAHKSNRAHVHDIHYKCVKSKHHSCKHKKAVTKEPAYVAPMAAAPAAYDDSALKQRIAELEGRKTPEAVAQAKDNMVFFRGGYARSNRHRDGVSINSPVGNVGNALVGGVADKDAWYFGAGLDFSVDDNLFGLMNNTEVLGEVMFQYKEFNDTVTGGPLATAGAVGALALANPLGAARNVTVNQFTLSASPKIKFLKGSDFRPWLIPVGFAINVVSPPTASITVLQPAMMFGLGADYRVWKNIYVGADARYYQALGRLDGVDTNGFTLGGYLGLGF